MKSKTRKTQVSLNLSAEAVAIIKAEYKSISQFILASPSINEESFKAFVRRYDNETFYRDVCRTSNRLPIDVECLHWPRQELLNLYLESLVIENYEIPSHYQFRYFTVNGKAEKRNP